MAQVRRWESELPLASGSRRTEWHCIGPIQSNKTRLVAENFDWVHTVDRLKIAQRLSEQRPAHLPPLQVCIQVNIDGGPTKSGVAPGEALALAQAVATLPRLVVRGLMCIPEPAHDFVADCEILTRARALFDSISSANKALAASAARPGPGAAQAAPLLGNFDTLSMGMTGDLEAAIHAGSTMVRVGTAIFGGRAKPSAPPG
jgi:PLP dependent protein